MKLLLTKEAREAINQHVLVTFPNECCGFFYGKDEEIRFVELTLPVKNNKEGDQRRRFEISPLDYMRAEKMAIDLNLTLLGIYHSHPLHPAIPSEHDLKQAVPFFSYIIVSVTPEKVEDTRTWKLNDKRIFVEEKIVDQIKRKKVLTI